MERCPEFRFKWGKKVSEHCVPLFVKCRHIKMFIYLCWEIFGITYTNHEYIFPLALSYL